MLYLFSSMQVKYDLLVCKTLAALSASSPSICGMFACYNNRLETRLPSAASQSVHTRILSATTQVVWCMFEENETPTVSPVSLWVNKKIKTILYNYFSQSHTGQ